MEQFTLDLQHYELEPFTTNTILRLEALSPSMLIGAQSLLKNMITSYHNWEHITRETVTGMQKILLGGPV
jgi:hypothetical protein